VNENILALKKSLCLASNHEEIEKEFGDHIRMVFQAQGLSIKRQKATKIVFTWFHVRLLKSRAKLVT
jgi:hypothetical protein